MAHVLHVISTLEPAGAQRQLVTFLRAAGAAGPRVSVAYLWGRGEFASDLPPSVRLLDLSRRGTFDPLSPLRLARSIIREDVDLVHTHLVHAGLVGKLAARWTARPVVITRHYTREQKARTLAYRLEDRWTRDAAAVIAVSSEVRDFLLRERLAPAERVHLIPNSVDPRFTADPSSGRPPRDRLVVGAAGRLQPLKGFDVLIEAWAELGDRLPPSARLEIVGEGPERARLERRIAALGVGATVSLAGSVAPGEMPVRMRSWDVVVVPSREEAFGLTAAEAMAAGRCLVVTDAPGLAELVTREVDALVVPAGEIGPLRDALARALGEPDLRVRLGAAARDGARRRSPGENAAAILALYASILGTA